MTRLLKNFFLNILAAMWLSCLFAAASYAVPPTFSDFATKTESGASLKIHWNGEGSGITYTVKYYPEGAPEEEASISDTGVYWRTINGLKANTAYYFQVLANGTPLHDDYVAATTYAMEIPSANFNPENNTFSWTDSENYPASGYKLIYSKHADLSSASEADVAPPARQYQAALESNTVYYYKLGAKNSGGIYNYKKDDYDIVYSAQTLPERITNFNIDSTDSSTANASWTISPTAAYRGDYYVLEASENGTFETIAAKSANLGTSVSGTALTGLRPNKQYYFRLRSVNSAGSVIAAAKAGGRTYAWTFAPHITTDPNVLSVTSDYSSITVNFQPLPASDCEEYILQASQNSSFPDDQTTSVEGGNGTSSLTVDLYNDDNPPYNKLFYLRIITTNKNDPADKTITDLGTKKTATIGPPQNLEISQIFQTSATITFDKIKPAPVSYIIKLYDEDGNIVIDSSGTALVPEDYPIGDTDNYDKKLKFETASSTVTLKPNRPYFTAVGASYSQDGKSVETSTSAVRYTWPDTVASFEVNNDSIYYSSVTISYSGVNAGKANNFKVEAADDQNFKNVVYSNDAINAVGIGLNFTIDPVLNYNTHYYLRGAMINYEGNGIYRSYEITTRANQPALEKLEATANTISAKLSPNGNPKGTEFRLDCSSTSANFSNQDIIISTAVISDNLSSFTMTCGDSQAPLDTSTEYYVRAVPINSSGTASPPLYLGTVSTYSPMPDVPENSNGYNIYQASITVKWTGTYNNGIKYPVDTRYRITVSTSTAESEDGNFTSIIASSIIKVSGQEPGQATFSGLTSNRQHYFKLAACNSNNENSPCGEAGTESLKANMPSAITLPSAPSVSASPDEVFTEAGLDSFKLNWKHNNNDESTDYEVYASSKCTDNLAEKILNGQSSECYVFSGVAESTTSYLFGGLARGETYTAIIRARGKSSTSTGTIVTDFINAGSKKTITRTGKTIYRDIEYRKDTENEPLEILTSYGSINVEIPLYAFSTTMRLEMVPMFAADFQSNSFTHTANVAGTKLIPLNVGVKITSSDNSAIYYSIDRPMTLTLSYNDEDLDNGRITSNNFPLSGASAISDSQRQKLLLAYHDEITDTWNPVESEVESDTENHKIVSRIWKLGTYQIMSTASQSSAGNVKIYPNPYKPNTNGGFVHFENLPDLGNGATVKIFTFLGELIKEINASGSSATWDGLNKNGNEAASGIYIVFVQSNDDKGLKKTYKLAIER